MRNIKKLKKSFIIFICTYDPFGKNRYIYTFKNCCIEDDSVVFEDDAIKVIVNVNGTNGEISRELKGVLDYISSGMTSTEYAKNLDRAVNNIKQDEKWRREYMTLYMRDKEHERIGKYCLKVSVIRKKKNKVNEEMLMDLLDIEKNEYDKIVSYINDYPDWEDEDIADKILYGEE